MNLEIMDMITQVAIVVFGCSSIWFVAQKKSWSRWGFVLGHDSQPFWFWLSWRTHSWGLGICSVWYLYSWAQGFYNHWLRRA